jgi:hypothetical protein
MYVPATIAEEGCIPANTSTSRYTHFGASDMQDEATAATIDAQMSITLMFTLVGLQTREIFFLNTPLA